RPPTVRAIRADLQRELEHLERHVVEGDAADPFEATYAIWNGARILHTLATGDPVISKRSAGAWALGHLPARWHPVIQAAGRAYDGRPTDDDRRLLEASMAPFVRLVRRKLPRAKTRGTRRPAPRWS
ncbi:MAG TPA: aminoglycoside adenylyltransferase domain-containing protein, partial [Candidatus Acidoferrales bacterium]|nr:aminoglycoside adenylyltransferase domain-containing protein [Candidatus Acidoferrales bacterium]